MSPREEIASPSPQINQSEPVCQDAVKLSVGHSIRIRFGFGDFEPLFAAAYGAIKRMTKTCPAMLAANRGVNWSGRHASSALKMDSVSA